MFRIGYKLLLILLISFSGSLSAFAIKKNICKDNDLKHCEENLIYNPLFDTDYKIAANYVPILPLRAFAHADIYKEKKSLHMDRKYYLKDANGKYGEPYETVSLNILVKASGLLGREVIASGTINEFYVNYHNKMKFSLPKHAHMDVKASIDGIPFLNLVVESDGDKMTNDVKGTFLTKEVNYHTDWRESKGTLAGMPYEVFAHGINKELDSFKAIASGKINNNSKITGETILIKPGHYEAVEYYGPIMVKTKVIVAPVHL